MRANILGRLTILGLAGYTVQNSSGHTSVNPYVLLGVVIPIENAKLVISIISIIALYALILVFSYRWWIAKAKSTSVRLALSIANGTMVLFIICAVLCAKFMPLHGFNILFVLIGIPAVIGPLSGFVIYKYHSR